MQGVTGQRRLGLASDKLMPDLPRGIVVIHHAVTEVGGKTFVEPEIFPILRGHQVAEPLMGDFMGDDLADAGLRFPRCHPGHVEQQVFTEGDRPPVFHGPEGKIGYGDQVHLGQRIVDGVVCFAVSQRLAAKRPGRRRSGPPSPAGRRHAPGDRRYPCGFQRAHTEK
jgi:hypothetical protein